MSILDNEVAWILEDQLIWLIFVGGVLEMVEFSLANDTSFQVWGGSKARGWVEKEEFSRGNFTLFLLNSILEETNSVSAFGNT